MTMAVVNSVEAREILRRGVVIPACPLALDENRRLDERRQRALVRLNYANELRYGVLSDLARSIWNEQPIDLEMGAFNAIWQGDANAAVLAACDHLSVPPRVINVAGPEQLSVRSIALEFGRLLGKPITLRGAEAADALLSNAQMSHRLFGYPRVVARQMMEWIADWVRRGGESLERPTHFQVRDGNF